MTIKKRHLIIGLASALILTFVGAQLKGQWDMNSELSRLRSLGVPTSRSELVESRSSDPVATEHYLKIYSQLEHTTSHGYTAFIRQPKIQPYHQKLLETNSDALNALREATRLGALAWYPATKNRDLELIGALPQVSAFVSSHNRDHEGALEWLQTLDLMTAQFREVPGFSRKNSREWNYPPVEQVLLRRVRDDKAALQKLHAYLLSRPPLPPPAVNLKLNFLEMDELVTNWSRDDMLAGAWRYSGPFGKRVRSTIRQTCLAVLGEIQLDEIDYASHQASILKALKAAKTKEARMFCNGMVTTLHMAYRAETLRRLELIAAEVLLRRLEAGSVPPRFECPTDLPDPFTDKPFSYRKLTDGFTVFSPGPNGAYDNGLADDVSISIQW